ncbi:hypothetical protein N9L45_00630 [Planctomycetota bacterium]|nr:hypothetical protein [Planctomycetota bacterium]
MSALKDILDAASSLYSALQQGTREYARETVREKMLESALIAATQLLLLLAAAALAWWTDGALWSRLLLSTAAIGCIGFNALKLLFHDLPQVFGFMNSWKKLWLDLMGINLFAIVVVENAGVFLFWFTLALTRSGLNWQVDILDPWLELN